MEPSRTMYLLLNQIHPPLLLGKIWSIWNSMELNFFFLYKFSKLNADIKSIVLFGAPWCPHTEFLVQSCAIWVVWEHFQRYLCYQICKPHQNGHNSFSFHPRSPRFHMEVDLYLISWPCLEKFMIFFLNPICPPSLYHICFPH